MSERVRVDRRMYLTADRRAVPDGHPDAAVLLCTPGDEMSRADAARYGLLPGQAAEAEPDPVPAAEPEAEREPPKTPVKRERRPADKSRQREGDKSEH